MGYITEANQLWALLVKICRAGQLKGEQNKCAFNLRTDEASATHYFQVWRIVNDKMQSAILFVYAVVWSPVSAAEHVTGKNPIPQSYVQIIDHRIMYVLQLTSQRFYKTVKCLRTR